MRRQPSISPILVVLAVLSCSAPVRAGDLVVGNLDQPVADSIQKGEHRAFLLYGVTGSGKTEVYLRAAAEALRRGRQVLYLVPEIRRRRDGVFQGAESFPEGVLELSHFGCSCRVSGAGGQVPVRGSP